MNATSLSDPLIVDFQLALDTPNSAILADVPTELEFVQWAEASYRASCTQPVPPPAEVTIRIVSEAEMAMLNETYRGKHGTTNVLSFPMELEFEFMTSDAEALPCALLGDVVICHAVVQREAAEQSKTVKQHYAHMVAHGVLHLVGFDHQSDAEANAMELLETQILNTLGLPNPYQ